MRIKVTLLQESAGGGPPSQLYYPSPNVSRPASQLTEEEQVSDEHLVHYEAHSHIYPVQVKIAQRIGLIQHLPTGNFDGCKKNRE